MPDNSMTIIADGQEVRTLKDILPDQPGLDRAGIPPFKIEVVPSPVEIQLNKIDVRNFHRFSIAYG